MWDRENQPGEPDVAAILVGGVWPERSVLVATRRPDGVVVAISSVSALDTLVGHLAGEVC
jgi:hypothetical protein